MIGFSKKKYANYSFFWTSIISAFRCTAGVPTNDLQFRKTLKSALFTKNQTTEPVRYEWCKIRKEYREQLEKQILYGLLFNKQRVTWANSVASHSWSKYNLCLVFSKTCNENVIVHGCFFFYTIGLCTLCNVAAYKVLRVSESHNSEGCCWN